MSSNAESIASSSAANPSDRIPGVLMRTTASGRGCSSRIVAQVGLVEDHHGFPTRVPRLDGSPMNPSQLDGPVEAANQQDHIDVGRKNLLGVSGSFAA